MIERRNKTDATVYLLLTGLKKKAIVKNRRPGTIALKPTITKNTCSWKYKSAGVNPTPRNDNPDKIAI